MNHLSAISPGTVERELAALGLTLPEAPPAVADYEPFSIVGTMVYTSGQLPWAPDGRLAYRGKIGQELTLEQGYAACQLSALFGLAQVAKAAGSPDRIVRLVRVEGVLNVAPGFIETPRVLDGASHLFNRVLGDRGRHSRVIATNPELPLDCACLVYLWAEILPCH
ncbi:RidA family protein [Pseudoroseomonas wenyumeiae]|uniref:RidA family protein n=1 Tax=Teichococcus wenyumeiae TaxID=2478470 RepID=A0A3A9JE50_9PROT|nr:RidA family protein [Pseudoroseomonas wenyumeiae]RKK02953.1 RidA family protein [Pseudoroseomonas wenyumeiae]RMI17444.1 RidA family protein [Pseudoroseomonas wenyumeiae]